VITLLDTCIYTVAVAETQRCGRRKAETAATSRLVAMALGAGARLAHRDDGAPYIDGCTSLHISITHARDIAALAVSCMQPVGIDIEYPRPQLLRVARRFLTPDEYSRIILHPGSHDSLLTALNSLTQAWTLKEARFKAMPHPVHATLADIPLPDGWLPDHAVCPGDGNPCVALYLADGRHICGTLGHFLNG